jgi:hypothetical protein
MIQLIAVIACAGAVIGLVWIAARKRDGRREQETAHLYGHYVTGIETLTQTYLIQAPSDEEWLAGIKTQAQETARVPAQVTIAGNVMRSPVVPDTVTPPQARPRTWSHERRHLPVRHRGVPRAASRRVRGVRGRGNPADQLSAATRWRIVAPPEAQWDFDERQDCRATTDDDSLRRSIRWQWHRTAQRLIIYAGLSGLAFVVFVLTRELGLAAQTAVKLSLACLASAIAGYFLRELLSTLSGKRQSRALTGTPSRPREHVGPGAAAGKAHPPGARLGRRRRATSLRRDDVPAEQNATDNGA